MTSACGEKKRMRARMMRFVKTSFGWAAGCWFLLPVLFVIPSSLPGQITEQNVLDLLRSRSTEDIRSELEKLSRRWPDSAELVYFTALLDSSGEAARTRFEELARRFPASPFAARALFRIGQMDFARGNYHRAAETFNRIIERYPHAAIRNEAEFLRARCHLLLNELNTAGLYYRKLLDRHLEADLRQRIELDLQQLAVLTAGQKEEPPAVSSKSAAQPAPPAPPPATGEKKDDRPATGTAQATYAVQVGSYGVRANAESQKKWFRLRGYPAEIVEYRTRNRLFYRVVIGEFSGVEAAEEFGRRLSRLFKIKYRIAKLDEKP